MSDFRAPIVRVRAVEPIPGADQIELAVVGDYRSVIRKGQYAPGDLVAYIPEQAVLPAALIDHLGLTGRLAGSAKNRVKAIKLRGCLSQGILMAIPGALEGSDAAGVLGITKYEPEIPASMAGAVVAIPGIPIKYDIENFKTYPDVLQEGEPVQFTEKIHGTFLGFTRVPGLGHDELLGTDCLVYSKGLGAKGLVFTDAPENGGNIYLQAAKAACLRERVELHFGDQSVTICAEIYGPGVQDLTYAQAARNIAVFDIHVGTGLSGYFLGRERLAAAVRQMGLSCVPALYSGRFSRAVMYEHTDGKTTLGGCHVREGVVVTPIVERRDDAIGRVILKSVSGDYLTRKNATELT